MMKFSVHKYCPKWAQVSMVRDIAETNDAIWKADRSLLHEFFEIWGKQQDQKFLVSEVESLMVSDGGNV